jgi:Predicted membrane protein
VKLFAKWFVCFLTLLCVWALFPAHIYAVFGIVTILVAATLLWAVNLLVRPLIQLIALPLSLLTLGLFSLVVNAAMVGLASAVTPGFSIRGFGFCFIVAVVIAIANTAISSERKRYG